MSKLLVLACLMMVAVFAAGCQPAEVIKKRLDTSEAEKKVEEKANYTFGEETEKTDLGTSTDPDSLEKEVDSYTIEEEAL